MKKRSLSYVLAGVALSLLTAMPASSVYAGNIAGNTAGNNAVNVAPNVSGESSKGTKFVTGKFADALAQAKKEGKKLMVDCYTLWCGPCRYMAKNVFPTEQLGQFMNERFVSIQIDMEHGEGPELQKQWKVKAYPTFIFFDGDGKEMSRFEGMAMQDEFQKRCERILDGKAPIDEEAEAQAKAKQAEQAEQAKAKAEKDTIIDEGKGVVFIKGSEVRLADVLAQAKRENKRVLVDFWADWCHACKQMDKTTLRDTRIGNLLNYSFVNYSVNMDTDPDAKEMLDKYKVMAFPTYLILNPDGSYYNRIIGSRTVEGFAQDITGALMGKEDKYVKMQREQEEQKAKERAERQTKLTDTAKSAPKTKTKFQKGQDLAKILKAAKGKKVIVYISDGDYKSEYMEKYSFNDPAIAEYLNKNYVMAFVDANSKAGDAAITENEVDESFPAFLMFDAEGNRLGSFSALLKDIDTVKTYFEAAFAQKK